MTRRHHLTARLAGLATTLGLTAALVLTAAPAQAVTYDHLDAVGDVQQLDQSGRRTNLLPRATEKSADITELRVRHGRSRLIMRLETVDLSRRGSFVLGQLFFVRTPARNYVVSVDALSTRRGTTRLAQLAFLGSGRSIRCEGLFSDFDFSGDVAMVSVPRRCLGSPRRVDIRAAMLKFDSAGDEVVLDSAMRDGLGDGLRLGRTPWIRTGPVRQAV